MYVYLDVPVTRFRVIGPSSPARWSTYPVPPPTTLFGCLMSYCGIKEPPRDIYKLAYAVDLSEQAINEVKARRFMHKAKDKHEIYFTTLEVMTGLKILMLIAGSLEEMLEEAYTNPSSITRYSTLSLGESTHIVNEITLSYDLYNFDLHYDNLVKIKPEKDSPDLTLPVRTHFGRLTKAKLQGVKLVKFEEFDEGDFFEVEPPIQESEI